MILAFALGILTITNTITVWHIILLGFLLGIVQAVDIPARQAYVPEMLDENKQLLSSAIALNSTIYNGARVIGPTIAGLLIAFFGLGMAFIFNGISYIAVLIALYFIKTKAIVPQVHQSAIKAIREGLRYSFSHPTIKSLLIMSAFISMFGWSYMTLMPVVAHEVFKQNAAGLGYLYAAMGMGALLTTIIISAYSQKIDAYKYILGQLFIFVVGLFLFSIAPTVILAYVFLFIIGFSLVGLFAMANTTIQHAVEVNMRGRVMSIYALAFMGTAPLGNFLIGYMADLFGSQMAIRICAIAVFLYGLYFYKNLGTLQRRQNYYEQRSTAL